MPAETHQALLSVGALKKGRTDAREPESVKPVREEHVVRVLPHVSRQVAAMIRLQGLSGMRSGEVTRMRPCDLDRSGQVWIYRPEDHKTAYRDHRREIFLGPQAQAILRPWLDRDAQSYCFSPAEAEAGRNAKRRARRASPLTPSQARRKPRPRRSRALRDHYDTDSYRQAICYGIAKAGVPHWHPHQLRHTCDTNVRRVCGLDAAQLVLGHKSADTTEIYAQANRAKAMEIIARLG